MVAGAMELGVLLTMASIGTGVYEVWGTPYDFVHARHTTEAYDPAAPEWMDATEVVETDLVQNDAHAQAIAARELIYRARSAQSYGMTIVDDPRIEPGDIIGLPDGTRLIWPQSAVELGALRNRFAIRLAEMFEMHLYRKAAFVSVVTPGMVERLVQRGVPRSKLFLLTNGVDTAVYQPASPDPDLAKKLGLDGRKVFLYAGTHG